MANSLDAHDIACESVVPDPARIREVNTNVATAVAWACHESGLAAKRLGESREQVADTRTF